MMTLSYHIFRMWLTLLALTQSPTLTEALLNQEYVFHSPSDDGIKMVNIRFDTNETLSLNVVFSRDDRVWTKSCMKVPYTLGDRVVLIGADHGCKMAVMEDWDQMLPEGGVMESLLEHHLKYVGDDEEQELETTIYSGEKINLRLKSTHSCTGNNTHTITHDLCNTTFWKSNLTCDQGTCAFNGEENLCQCDPGFSGPKCNRLNCMTRQGDNDNKCANRCNNNRDNQTAFCSYKEGGEEKKGICIYTLESVADGHGGHTTIYPSTCEELCTTDLACNQTVGPFGCGLILKDVFEKALRSSEECKPDSCVECNDDNDCGQRQTEDGLASVQLTCHNHKCSVKCPLTSPNHENIHTFQQCSQCGIHQGNTSEGLPCITGGSLDGNMTCCYRTEYHSIPECRERCDSKLARESPDCEVPLSCMGPEVHDLHIECIACAATCRNNR